MWDDVDLDEGVVRVRRSVQRQTWEHGCEDVEGKPPAGASAARSATAGPRGGLLLVEPKTRASRRTMALPPPLVEELRAHRAAGELNAASPPASDWDTSHDLVFPAADGGLIDPPRDHREWKAMLKKAGSVTCACTTPATPRRRFYWSRASTSAPSCRSWAGPRWPPPSATPTRSTSSVVGPHDDGSAALGSNGRVQLVDAARLSCPTLEVSGLPPRARTGGGPGRRRRRRWRRCRSRRRSGTCPRRRAGRATLVTDAQLEVLRLPAAADDGLPVDSFAETFEVRTLFVFQGRPAVRRRQRSAFGGASWRGAGAAPGHPRWSTCS